MNGSGVQRLRALTRKRETITVSLDPQLDQEVRAFARRVGMPVSTLFRVAVLRLMRPKGGTGNGG